MKAKSLIKNSFRIETKTVAKFALSVLLVIGGLQGLHIISGVLSSSLSDFSGAMLSLFLLAFYSGCLFAAYLLRKRQELGLRVALVLFCLQIPRIDTPTLGYRLASGFGSWFRQSAEGWTLVTNWTSCFKFNFVTGYGPNFGAGPSYYGVNIFAVIVATGLVIAIRAGSKARAQEEVSRSS